LPGILLFDRENAQEFELDRDVIGQLVCAWRDLKAEGFVLG